MSDATKAALDAAVRAHIADEYDDSLTSSWLLIAERVSDEDDGMTHIVDVAADMQSATTSIGLAYFVAQRRVFGANDA